MYWYVEKVVPSFSAITSEFGPIQKQVNFNWFTTLMWTISWNISEIVIYATKPNGLNFMVNFVWLWSCHICCNQRSTQFCRKLLTFHSKHGKLFYVISEWVMWRNGNFLGGFRNSLAILDSCKKLILNFLWPYGS